MRFYAGSIRQMVANLHHPGFNRIQILDECCELAKPVDCILLPMDFYRPFVRYERFARVKITKPATTSIAGIPGQVDERQ